MALAIRNKEEAMVPSFNPVGLQEQTTVQHKKCDNIYNVFINNTLKEKQDKDFNNMKDLHKGSRFISFDSPVSSGFLPYVALAVITAAATAVIFSAGFVAGCAFRTP